MPSPIARLRHHEYFLVLANHYLEGLEKKEQFARHLSNKSKIEKF